MAQIRSYGPLAHLRAEPNQFVLHYRRGKLVRRGVGLAYWFSPLSASVAQLPVEDVETTFVFNERSADLQDVSVQCTLTYRIVDPERAASRVNFSLQLPAGVWQEQPLQRLAAFWSQRTQAPARTAITTATVIEAVRAGADVVRRAVLESMAKDAEIPSMGLSVVDVQVVRVAPTPDLEKALQTPTREALQQKADEATFARRALAVEKERAIKENELATEVELARRREDLIRREAANKLLQVRTDAEAEQARIEAEIARTALEAEAEARNAGTRAEGEANAHRKLAGAQAEGEAARLAVWREAPARVLLGLALREAAGKIGSIQHLNLTPDLIGAALEQLVRDQSAK